MLLRRAVFGGRSRAKLHRGTRQLGCLAVGFFAIACGRSDLVDQRLGVEILPGDGGTEPECAGDLDCQPYDQCAPRQCVEGVCVDLTPVNCDDGDECTEDTCDPATGACSSRPWSFDLDGDGFNGPRPGFAPGASGSCGDDCDDTSPAAFPGGVELCDGVDNDCNGVVDDGAGYKPAESAPILVAEGEQNSAVGSLAYNGDFYGVAFGTELDSWENTFKGLGTDGETIVPATPITDVNADTFTGPLVWTGEIFAAAWEDRRDGDFEIYFNRFDHDGHKLGPDVRVTNAPDFSLRPTMVWNGAEFVLAWSDQRNGEGDYRIYGQRIDRQGKLIGDNVELTSQGYNAEAPSLAEGQSTLGVSFNVEVDGQRRVAFRILSPDLSDGGEVVVLSGDGGVGASTVYNGDRYVVVWSLRNVVPGDSIHGAAVAEDGTVLIAERPITTAAPFARSESILPLGDRLLLVWAEDQTGNYELYAKMLDANLDELSPATRITSGGYDVANPVAAFGPNGDVGILFEGLQSQYWQVYFTKLACAVNVR